MAARRAAFVNARRAAGYTQESLAAAVSVDRSTVVRWESGKSAPWPYLWPRLAKLLGVSRAEMACLLNGSEQAVVAPLGPAFGGKLVGEPRPDRHSSGAAPEPELDLLSVFDHTRLLVDQTLSIGMASPIRLDLIEERVVGHLCSYTRMAPLSVLQRLAPDFLEVQSLAADRQPAVVQSRLSEVTALLSLLSADALMKLGEVDRARYWYGTARLAADDTFNTELRASVRAQHAMLPYYYGDLEQTVRLAREAQALAPAASCHPAALAAAAEARALARLGNVDAAEQAMHRAQRLLDALDDQWEDVAFRFTEKRLLLYLSGTLTYLGQRDRACRVQEQALMRYRREPSILIDPALIQLDHAVGEAAYGNSDDACQLAVIVLEQLPAKHRTRIVLTRARDVLRAIPGGQRRRSPVGELRELVGSYEAISP